MKKLLTALSIIILLSFSVEKTYTVHYTIPQWNNKLAILEATRIALSQSDLPTKQSIPLMDSLTIFQNELRAQLIPQTVDTTKKK